VAVVQIKNSLSFYAAYFKEKAKLDWDASKAAARNFLPFLREKWPHFVEEMEGMYIYSGCKKILDFLAFYVFSFFSFFFSFFFPVSFLFLLLLLYLSTIVTAIPRHC
jgi:hypothetical protein